MMIDSFIPCLEKMKHTSKNTTKDVVAVQLVVGVALFVVSIDWFVPIGLCLHVSMGFSLWS